MTHHGIQIDGKEAWPLFPYFQHWIPNLRRDRGASVNLVEDDCADDEWELLVNHECWAKTRKDCTV